MDGDMWAARLLSKRQYAVHSMLAADVDDIEGDEELRPDFACPYCFEALDLLSLFTHLEDEHFSETRIVLCPVCAAKVGKDMIGHFTLHHDNLLKLQRRRKFRRPGLTSSHSNFPFNGKELNQAHLQALLGACTPVRTGSGSGIPDLLLSTLVCNMPCDDSSKLITLDNSDASTKASAAPCGPSADSKLTAEKREQKLEEATVRSKFVRQLIVSTLWAES